MPEEAENAAIIGPNHLEILFPSAYYVCKRPLREGRRPCKGSKSRPNVGGPPGANHLSAEAEARRPKGNGGGPVRAPSPNRSPAKATENEPRADRREINDPYAEKARSIFGAKIVRVEAAFASAAKAAMSEAVRRSDGDVQGNLEFRRRSSKRRSRSRAVPRKCRPSSVSCASRARPGGEHGRRCRPAACSGYCRRQDRAVPAQRSPTQKCWKIC